MNYKNVFFSWSVVFLATAISACGSARSSYRLSPAESPYTYADPRSGEAVPMRLSDGNGFAQQAEQEAHLSLTNSKVQIKNGSVIVSLDKTVRGITQHITMQGSLNQESSAQLDDTEPVNGKSRMKGYLHCTKDNCAELYVEVYFYLDGERTSRQLNVRNIENDLTEKLAAVQPQQNETTEPPAAAANEVEADHGTDEVFTDNGNGTYVAPAPDSAFMNNLLDDKNSTPTPAAKKVSRPSNPGTLADDEPFNFANLILSGGGTSVDSPNGGSIRQSGTILPTQGPGFRRVSDDQKAHGTGYSVSLIEEAAYNYTKMHPECGIVTVRDISEASGGPLYFDKPMGGRTQADSHQNGLDFDTAYLPLTDLKYVVHNRKLDSDFAMTCNYNWFKYLANLKMPDSGRPLVHLIIVNTIVKNALCQYQKTNDFFTAADTQLQNTVYATGDGHDNHAHIRFYCSPKHRDCYDGDANPIHFQCAGESNGKNI